MFSRWLRLAMLLGAMLAARPTLSAQFSVATNVTDVFRSLGRDSNGTVWIAGERNGGIAALFQLVGTNFVSTNLAELVEGETSAFSISRDARTVVGYSGDEAVLWNVSTPGTAQGLGIPAGRSFSEAHGVSGGANPTVVGYAGTGAFVWNASSGMQTFPNPSGHFTPSLDAISVDGQTIVGAASGTLTSVDPLVYQGGTSSFLDEAGGNVSHAISVSPNGNIIGGYIDNQGTVWNGGVPIRLMLNGNPVGQVLGVTDNGFAVGSTAAGGYIYDPRTGLTSLFDAWWLLQTGSAPPVHVTSINDIYWDGQMLYFALSGSSAGAAAGLALAWSPPPNLAFTLLPDGQLELRWPTNQTCTVEAASTLTAPPDWTPLTNAVPVVNNSQLTLTLPATNAASYFRLRCP